MLSVDNRAKRQIFAIVSTFMVCLMAWSFASPVASSPDEGDILASIWCANGTREDVCQIDQHGIWHVPNGIYNWCFQHNPEISASCSNSYKRTQLVPADEQIKVTEYSKLLSRFAGNPPSTHVLAIRLANDVFVCLLLLMSLLISNRRSQKLIVLLTAILFVPNTLYLLSSAHPSGNVALISILASASATQLNLKASRNIFRDYHFQFLAMLVVLMFTVRRDGLLLLLIGLCVLIFSRLLLESTDVIKLVAGHRRGFGIAAALAAIAFTQIDKWKSIFPLTLNIWGSPVNPRERAAWNVLTTNIQNFPSLIMGQSGYWGLGALDVQMPIIVWSTTAAAMVACIAISLVFSSNKVRIYFLISMLMYISLTLKILQTSKLYVGEEMQPRYLFPLLVVAMVGTVMRSNLDALRKFNVSNLIVGMVVLLGFAHSIALWTTLRRYTSGLDAGELDLDVMREWWWSNAPLGPNAIWLIGTVSFLAFAVSPITMSRNKVFLKKKK